MKFTDHTGMYMLHCHMVEHEGRRNDDAFEVVVRADPTPKPRRLRGRDRWRTKVASRVDQTIELHFAGLVVMPEQCSHCDVKFQPRSFARITSHR